MKKNTKIKRILTVALVLILLIGLASALILLKPKDEKNIDSSYFVVGKINDNGQFMKSDDYLCTEDLIACDGLVVKPTFDATSKYKLFFYDNDYNLVSITDELEDNYYFLDSFPFVEYCRIMIIPDRNGKSVDDFKVTIFNKNSYLNQFDISVDTKQVFNKYMDYFEADLSLLNKTLSNQWSSYSFKDFEGLGVSKIVDLTGVRAVCFITTDPVYSANSRIEFIGLDAEGNPADYKYSIPYNESNGYYVGVIDCSNYSSIIFAYSLGSECHLYLDKG